MKSYFAYLGRGCCNYIEEKVDGGTVDIIQKGQRYYYVTHASSIDAIIKCHQTKESEVYDKIAKIINMHFVSFTSILKGNIVSNGVYPVELYSDYSLVLIAKNTHIVTTRNMVCIKSSKGKFIHTGDKSISDETFQRLLALTENTLDQIDDIWRTI